MNSARCLRLGLFVCVLAGAMSPRAAARQPALFSVERYGAAGDGQADDAGAVQRAIDAAEAAGGGVVTFEAGKTYLLGRGIVVDGDRVVLSGTGATVRLRDGVNAKAVLLVTGTEDRKVKDVAVSGLTVDANYGGQTEKNKPRGVYVLHARNVRLEGVTVKNAWVSMDFGRGAQHCVARRCLCTRFYNDGFEVSGTGVPPGHDPHHIVFVDCHTSDPQPKGADNAWEIEDGAHDVAVIECTSQKRRIEVRNHKTGNTISKDIYFIHSAAPKFSLRGRPQVDNNWVQDIFFYGSSGPIRKGARVRNVSEIGKEEMTLSHDVATIPAGKTSVTVPVRAITTDSKVFVAAATPTGGQGLVVGPPRPGTGFEVRLGGAHAEDIRFDWWVVARTRVDATRG